MVSAEQLADDIDRIASQTGTYMLTEFLENSEGLREICGDTVASVRIVMLVRDGEPEFFKALALLPGPGAHVSNLKDFSTGSVPAKVNLQDGTIEEVLLGAGPEWRTTDHHPVTGVRLVGRVLDGWSQVRSVMLEASRAMSPFRMQHWDMALTSRGPVIMEMNFIGSLDGCQIFGPPGLYTEQYLAFRSSCLIDD